MSDIFIDTSVQRPPRPDHGNNCHGHFTSISSGVMVTLMVMVVVVMELIPNQI